jgi:hypothetical protein
MMKNIVALLLCSKSVKRKFHKREGNFSKYVERNVRKLFFLITESLKSLPTLVNFRSTFVLLQKFVTLIQNKTEHERNNASDNKYIFISLIREL